MTWLADYLFGRYLHEMNTAFGDLGDMVKAVQFTAEEIEAQLEIANNGVDEIVDKLKYNDSMNR